MTTLAASRPGYLQARHVMQQEELLQQATSLVGLRLLEQVRGLAALLCGAAGRLGGVWPEPSRAGTV